MACLRCGKIFGDKIIKVSYTIAYDKCQGKICPDCGKERKLGWNEVIQTDNPNFFNPCIKCKREVNYWIDKLCGRCFLERERKRGCVCFYDKDYNEGEGHHSNINYYCPLCEEAHPREALCKECFQKQTEQHNRNRQIFLKVILPTAIISLIVGFFLGWLFFRKLWKIKE